jgi:hypothetical protein
MWLRDRINDHAYTFMRKLLNRNESMVLNALRYPAVSAEVIMQVMANAICKGITCGYIMNQLLTEFFDVDDTTMNGMVLAAIIADAYLVLFTKTLSVHARFFNPLSADLSNELLNNAKISRLNLFFDFIFTAIKTTAVSALLYRHVDTHNQMNIFSATCLGTTLMSHGMYVRYKNRKYQAALDDKLKQPLLSNPVQAVRLSEETSSAVMFDIIKNKLKSKSLDNIVTFINAGALIGRWFAFLGFLVTLNSQLKKSTDVNLDFFDLICIQQLWGNVALETDAVFYQQLMVENLAYYKTKLFIEKKIPHFGPGTAFFKVKSDYPKSYLKLFINSESKVTVQELLDVNHSNQAASDGSLASMNSPSRAVSDKLLNREDYDISGGAYIRMR